MKTLEIILSAALAFSVGLIWYKIIFKGHWTKTTSDSDAPRNKITDYILVFLSLCAVSYFMNNGCLETHINGGNLGHGIFHGGLYGLSYAVPIISILHVIQKKSLKEFFVDSGYALICFAAIGGMLAALPLMVY